MKRKRWIWIGGWGLHPEWLEACVNQAYPIFEHVAVPPAPGAIDAINWSRFDRVGGYSLGAFLLLKEAGKIKLPTLLIAPFFAYYAEAGLGGKIRQVQIRYLARWLERDPRTALADFYQRAALDVAPSDKPPYPMEDLQWGLQQLAAEEVAPQLPEGWRGILGASDPLLDAHALEAQEPRLEIVPSAGHHPAPLLAAAAGEEP